MGPFIRDYGAIGAGCAAIYLLRNKPWYWMVGGYLLVSWGVDYLMHEQVVLDLLQGTNLSGAA